MKVTLVSVGRPSALLSPAIQEFDSRAGRYWKLETVDVSPEKASKNRPVSEVRAAEAERIRAVVPEGTEIVALTRTGATWSSHEMSQYLNQLGITGSAGATFIIGGAFGLDRSILREARHQLTLSPMTLPHDMARLILAEQIYRAGTIVRGEPYHKG